jgi:uncharacterized protein (DUF924 family)
MSHADDYQPVLDFWFTELTPKSWFSTSPDLDAQIKDRFLSLHQAAAKGKRRYCGAGAE